MRSPQLGFAHGLEGAEAPGAQNQHHWYAAYTCPHHEKKVAEQIRLRSFECFLPLYEVFHRWKDRRMRLRLPLFPSYVFVRLDLRDRFRVLQVPGIVRLVGFNGLPAPISGENMQALQNGLSSGMRAQPHPYLRAGQPVRVKTGPLCGMEGLFVRKKNRWRFIISLNVIMRSVALEIESNNVELLG
jgi:transcription termination/antitermination protein NusG